MEITSSTILDCPASSVWALLEDFGSIQTWWPRNGPITIEQVVCEGDGVGMIRHIHNVGMSAPISERLDFLDPEEKTLILSIVGDRPSGITAYVAIGCVTEISERQCRLNYRAYVTTVPGKELKAKKGILLTWDIMFSALRGAF